MKIPRPLRLLYVEWDDAATRSRWMSPDELSRYVTGSWLTRQVGILIQDTAAHLVIAGSWVAEDEWREEQFGDVTRIPKTWIRTRRLLAFVNDAGTVRLHR